MDRCGVWTKNNGENALSDREETNMIRMQKSENEYQFDNHQQMRERVERWSERFGMQDWQ